MTSSQAPTDTSLIGSASGSLSHPPYVLYAVTHRPPGAAGADGGGAGGARGRDPVQVLCPYTGSNVTAARPLRAPAASSKTGAFGVRCLLPVPVTRLLGAGGADADAALFVGHGGAGGTARTAGAARAGGRDDHAFLVGPGEGGGGEVPRWQVRPPERLAASPQSLAASPDGRLLAGGAASGTCFLWDWTAGGDNLARAWKAHHRPVTCLAFDADDGATLFTAGEDGVVNAWCVLDLADRERGAAAGGAAAVRPLATWAEHQLPVTSLCVLPGSGRGATRVVSSSLDRNVIIMELGGPAEGTSRDGSGGGTARTLARLCLPSGLHTLVADAACERLYGGGADGTIYCIDTCRHAIQETLQWAGTVVNVNQSDGGATAAGDVASLLSGRHVLPLAAASAASGLSPDQSTYVSELTGHAKAVTALALLDPAAAGDAPGGPVLLASGSADGTLRVWDLRSRSCVRVLRPWAPAPTGAALAAAPSGASAPPVTGLLAVPRACATAPRPGGRRRAPGDAAALFHPLNRFARGAGVLDRDGREAAAAPGDCAALVAPRRDAAFVDFWEAPIPADDAAPPGKRARRAAGAGRGESAEESAEVARLRAALAESQAVIERWQTVNNQLVAQLQTK